MIGPGSRLAHYEIDSALGKGGMGEVWRARDTKLGREVAIKTLPPEFADDADRLARFEREAKLLASLNHPNIAAIYGLEEHEGFRFLVLELIEGDTLGDRIKQGPIPIEESLKLSLQIADALKAAHENGVIHRDLKPDNIKVSDDGNIKVLDFGLAKALSAEESEVNVSNSPTLSMAATQAGMILGTAAYMSPEQAKGRAVDRRADIFAFGCVLYEMLSGKQSFGASDVSESLAAVIRSEPEWDGLPANLDPRLSETLKRCLHKQIVHRYQDIGDVRNDVERVLSEPHAVAERQVLELAGRRSSARLFVTSLIFGIVVVWLVVWTLRPDPGNQPLWFEAVLPEYAAMSTTGGSRDIAISPDGTKILYRGTDRGIYVKFLDELRDPVRLAEARATDVNTRFFFSGDGSEVIYGSPEAGPLYRVPIDTGTPRTIAAGDFSLQGGSWGNDEIVFASGLPRQGVARLLRVSTASGEPRPVLLSEETEGSPVWPHVLPGGRQVLVTMWEGTAANSQIHVVDLEAGESYAVFCCGTGPQYVPTGHLLYGVEGQVWAVRFDLNSLTVSGEPALVVEGVHMSRGSGSANFAVSDTGTLVYVENVANSDDGAAAVPLGALTWISGDDDEERLGIEQGSYSRPHFSPDGTRLAVSRLDDSGDSDIWIADLTRNPLQLTSLTPDNPGADESPIWLNDETIVFTSLRNDQAAFYSVRYDGTDLRLVAECETVFGNPIANSVSPDGLNFLYSYVAGPGTLVDIGRVFMEDGSCEPLIQTPDNELSGMVSPDGEWVAFTSDRDGLEGVFVQRFPGPGGLVKIAANSTSPLWDEDTNELFYERDDGALVAVRYEISNEFEVVDENILTAPREDTQAQGIRGRQRVLRMVDYAYHSGEDRFLVVRREPGSDVTAAPFAPEPQRIIVATNWTSFLEETLPVARWWEFWN